MIVVRRGQLLAICGALIATLSVVDRASAQATTTASDPTQIERRIDARKPRRPEALQPNLDILPDSQVTPTGDKFSFVLSAVIIEGATAFAPADLAPLYGKYLARKVTEVEVREIAQAVTRVYRDAGYVFSQADVPAQDVLAGVLKIRVTEGFVSNVAFDDKVSRDSVVAAYLAPVLAEKPVRLETIERALLLVNDLPDVTVADASVGDGDAPGAKVLKLKLDYTAVNAELYLDNRGTPSSGRLQGWAAGAANGLLSVGNRLQVGVFTIPDAPRELLYGIARWSQPLGRWGTTGELALSGSKADAGADLAASDTESDSFRIHLTLRHPVLRTRQDSLWAIGELDFFNVNEDRFGATNFEDRNRTARLGLEYYRAKVLNGDFYAKGVYARGLDVLGASSAGNRQLSRSDGRAEFDKVTLEVRRLQKLWGGFGLYAQAKGQWGNQPLLTASEFSLGGSQYGRAYDYGEAVGDRGAAGAVELRYTGRKPAAWVETYDLYAFYDGGAVWNDGADRQILTSAGAGVRATFAGGIYGDLQIAKPLNHAVSTEGDKDLRILFSVGAGL
ncbi:MAG: hypothetical protein COW30_06625 [Rhodospirillales bacterium CG15_BIG_FIL_POST_REV_8_21_14_020_66_15]|nr:MAG: hypothetical protein COW30_06625 [Rhodospirillales bacterium CG15_BIG_FIL_POST_REV_8_21_14_020_66_15]